MEESSNGQRGEPNAPFGVSIYHRLEFTFMNFFFFFLNIQTWDVFGCVGIGIFFGRNNWNLNSLLYI